MKKYKWKKSKNVNDKNEIIKQTIYKSFKNDEQKSKRKEDFFDSNEKSMQKPLRNKVKNARHASMRSIQPSFSIDLKNHGRI